VVAWSGFALDVCWFSPRIWVGGQVSDVVSMVVSCLGSRLGVRWLLILFGGGAREVVEWLLLCICGEMHLETLSHIFLNCPCVQPVIQWVSKTFEALFQRAYPDKPIIMVPQTAAVILVHDWQEGPQGKVRQFWTHMRVATPGAIWELRCSGSSSPHQCTNLRPW
jgi:hypothetical protein